MQNFIGLAQANLASADAKEDAPWYVKYGARGFGTIAGGMAMFMGALNAITSILNPLCIVLSVWQVVVGFAVITIEAPCCCFFVEHVQVLSQKIESKPLYIKAAVYVIAPLPTIFFCFGFGTFFGSGLVVACGVMYGFIALGKKASRAEMAQNAQSVLPTTAPPTSNYSTPSTLKDDKRILVENLRDPSPFAPSYQSPNVNFGPPPKYTDLQEEGNNRSSSGGGSSYPVDWNTPFTPTPPPPNSNKNTNVDSTNPYNPFQ